MWLVPPHASRCSAAHTNTTKMRIDKHTHAHTTLRIHTYHGICFCNGQHKSTMYDVLLRNRSGSGIHMTPGVMCSATYQLYEEHHTGDCVQSVDLLHVGSTKQPGFEHGAHHHGREHHTLVSFSTYLFRHLSPFGICSGSCTRPNTMLPLKWLNLLCTPT